MVGVVPLIAYGFEWRMRKLRITALAKCSCAAVIEPFCHSSPMRTASGVDHPFQQTVIAQMHSGAA